MSWFKVDDKLWGSPKWIGLRAGARALWVTAGSYSMDQLTDGFIPTHVLPMLGARRLDAIALVGVGLWDECDASDVRRAPDNDASDVRRTPGYRFHDWNVYQPSRDSILDKRDGEAARKAAWRAKLAGQRAASANGHADVPPMSHGDNDETSHVVPGVVPHVSRSSRPDPTRPDPTTPKGVPRESGTAPTDAGAKTRRGTRIPEPFVVTDVMVEWAKTNTPGLDLDRVTAKFIDYWVAIPGAKGTKLNWESTWRNWLRRETESHVQPQAPDRGRGFWGKPVTS